MKRCIETGHPIRRGGRGGQPVPVVRRHLGVGRHWRHHRGRVRVRVDAMTM
jgi:hypothetical protein